MSKYPKLIQTFPEDIVEKCLDCLEQSEDSFKEYLLELCHTYFQQANYAFWTGISAYASSLAEKFTLENFELFQEEHGKPD